MLLLMWMQPSLQDFYLDSSSTLLLMRMRTSLRGVGAGLDDPSSVTTNHRTGMPQYTGKPLATAMAVCAAGQGGMVLFSDCTMAQVCVRVEIGM